MAWLALFARERGADNPRDDRRHLIVYRPPGRDAAGRPKAARPIKDARVAWRNALARIAGGRRWRFHDVRATYVTEVALVASSATTQQLARHKHPSTTQRYTKITDEAKRAAVEEMRRPQTAPAAFDIRSPTAQSHRAILRRVK